MSILEARDLYVSYGAIKALRGVTLDVARGEVVAVIGANGAGKSTLMRALSRMKAAASGGVIFKGASTDGLGAHDLARQGLLHIPEGRGVLGRMSVLENLRLSYDRIPHASGDVTFEQALERVFRYFPRIKERLSQIAGNLSGGEQQQLAMARPLLAAPDLLMLDEPSLGLSPVMVRNIFSIMREFKAEGMTMLVVEQNARLALKLADRAYVLKHGAIVHAGTSEALLHDDAILKHYLGS